jgi:hypothetical protein
VKVGDLVRLKHRGWPAHRSSDLGLILESSQHPYGSVYFRVQRLRDGKILSSLSSDLELLNESR